MDLFRRIFGKTSEEMVSNDKVAAEKAAEEVAPQVNGLDPETRPVTATPVPIAEGVTQPLNPEALISTYTNEHIAFGQATDVGLVRNNNQDSALSFFFTSRSMEEKPDFGLFVIADGMGGHMEGERASAITVRVLAAQVTNSIYLPILSGTNDADQTPAAEALVSGIQKANTEVIQQVPDGGTTVTAVVVIGDLAYVAHVGDSRAYFVTPDGVEQITRDHSLVQRLIELGQLTEDEAAEHPQKNVLYRALGQNETLEVDIWKRRLTSNSRILLCSDGLWGLVEEREIYEIVMNSADPQQACDKLVALANTRGGTDNITAILLKVS
jgi:PPM family protein phosphatase